MLASSARSAVSLGAIVTGLALLAPAAGAAVRVDAPPRAAAIEVDAASTDWDGRFVQVGDRALDVAAVHDGDFLYLCVLFGDSGQRRRLMTSGLELSVTPNSMSDAIRLVHPLPSGPRGGGRPGAPTEPPDDDAIADAFEANAGRAAWRTGDDALSPRSLDEIGPTRVAAAPYSGVFVYEVRIPLAPDDAWGAAAGPDDTIVVTLRTPSMPAPAGLDRPRRGGGPPGGGMGGGIGRGRGGGPRGGGGPMRGGGPRGGGPPSGGPGRFDRDRPEPIELELEVHLTR
jgi:hypothetical protein